MSGAYPQFKTAYTHEELVEHFLLTPADLQLVALTCRRQANRCGMALLLATAIPAEIRNGNYDRMRKRSMPTIIQTIVAAAPTRTPAVASGEDRRSSRSTR